MGRYKKQLRSAEKKIKKKMRELERDIKEAKNDEEEEFVDICKIGKNYLRWALRKVTVGNKHKKQLRIGKEMTRERIRELRDEINSGTMSPEAIEKYNIGIHYMQVTLLAFGLEMESTDD